MTTCTILIVDDEILVRTNIKMLIDWKNDGFSLYGEASNGAEALSSIQGKPPDIVITDMKMPVMDGLELVRQFMQKYPRTTLIALSNYDDYEYVRGTLKNGAADYLLKHKLDRQILLEALSRAKTLYNSHGQLDKSNETENNLAALRRKFIIQILAGVYHDTEEVRAHIFFLGIKLDIANIVPVVMAVDTGTDTAQSLRDSNSMEYAVLNVTQEILDDCGNGAVCSIDGGLFCILVSYEGIPSKQVIDDKLNTLLWRIQSTLKQFVNLSARFVVGEVCIHPSDVPRVFEDTKRYFEEQPFADKNNIRKVHDRTSSQRDLSGLSAAMEEELAEAALSQSVDSVDAVIGKIFAHIQANRLDTVSSHLIFTDMLGIADRLCKKYMPEQPAIRERTQALVYLLSSWDMVKIRQSFLGLFTLIGEYLPGKPGKTYSANIEAALKIIRQNYSGVISQQAVADKIGISAAYLSNLFNNELGMSFTDYLMDLRLQKAKELFEKGERDIRKVATDCGINDYHYFFRVFKKKYEITPREFISRQH